MKKEDLKEGQLVILRDNNTLRRYRAHVYNSIYGVYVYALVVKFYVNDIKDDLTVGNYDIIKVFGEKGSVTDHELDRELLYQREDELYRLKMPEAFGNYYLALEKVGTFKLYSGLSWFSDKCMFTNEEIKMLPHQDFVKTLKKELVKC